MFGRALSSVGLAIILCCSAAVTVRAQNLEAGKSPQQIFNGACAVCHKSPRGLLKTVPPGSLPGFLRQHYTTSSTMAATLSSYLLANGVVDRREREAPRRGRREARPDVAPEAAPAPAPSGFFRWLNQPSAQRPGIPSAEPASEAGRPDRKSSAKHRKGKKSKPVKDESRQGEVPQQAPNGAAAGESTKPDTAKSDASKSGVSNGDKPAAASPASVPSETAGGKDDASKSAPTVRADPVPAVTPAPSASEPKISEPKASEPKAPEPKASDSKAD